MIVTLLYIDRSPDCFQLEWPMNKEHDFFYVDFCEDPKRKNNKGSDKLKTEKKTEENDEEMEVN